MVLTMPTIDLVAPKGKFRVTGYDSFSHDDWMEGDYDTAKEALKVAKKKGGQMTLMYVWDDKGTRIGKEGSF
jgi:hypothetical protein